MSEKPKNDLSQKGTFGSPYVSPVQKNRKLIVILTIGLVVLVGVVLGFVSGRLYAGMKAPGQKVQLAYQVCGDEIVQRYEEEIYFPLDEKNSPAANKLKETITADPNYRDDPTCQTILFWLAEDKGDKDAMAASLGVVKRLHQEGIYTNSGLHDGALNYLEDAVTWINEDNTADEE